MWKRPCWWDTEGLMAAALLLAWGIGISSKASKGETPIPDLLHHHLRLFPSPSLPGVWDTPLASQGLCLRMSRASAPRSWQWDISERLWSFIRPKGTQSIRTSWTAWLQFWTLGQALIWRCLSSSHGSDGTGLAPREAISNNCSSWSPSSAKAESLWVLVSLPTPALMNFKATRNAGAILVSSASGFTRMAWF